MHLTVAKTEIGHGHGKGLLASAEESALAQGARLLQCTIREGNVESEGLFQAVGFIRVGSFFNKHSGNKGNVFQKVLVKPH